MPRMQEKARFRAVVDHVGDAAVFVRITRHDSCASCSAYGECHGKALKQEQRILEVARPSGWNLQEGQEVFLEASRSMGSKAVMIGYGLPLLVVLSMLFAGKVLSLGEPMMALLALLGLAFYFSVLLLLRKRLNGRFAFTLVPKSGEDPLQNA